MVPKRKIARKSVSRKRPKRPKKALRPKRKRQQIPVAVGDAVRLPSETHNVIARYDPRLTRTARGTEAIEGIACSVREIASGKLVPKTRGDLTGYVLEILHSQTFRFQFSSERNTSGSAGPATLAGNPVWLKVRALLQEMAGRGQPLSAGSDLLSQEPLASLLDGWRVVKVKAEVVEPLE